MEIRVKIEKKHAFLIAGALALFALSIFAYAYTLDGSGTPNVMGHSVGEIDWSKPIRSNISFSNMSIMEFGADDSAKTNSADHFSGSIAYKQWYGADALDIIGAGTGANRIVRMWDKLVVSSDVCLANGRCLSNVSGGSYSISDTGVIDYATQSCDTICGVGMTITAYAENPPRGGNSWSEVSSGWSNSALRGRCKCLARS